MIISPDEFQRFDEQYEDHKAQCEALLHLKWSAAAADSLGVEVCSTRSEEGVLSFRFEATVAATPERIISDLYEIRAIIPELADSKRGGTIFRYVYFPDEQTRRNVGVMTEDGQFCYENTNIVYMAVESPSSLVKSRDIICLRRAVEIDPGERYRIYINPIMPEERRIDELERESFIGIFDVEKNGETSNVVACCSLDPPSEAPSLLVETKLRSMSSVLGELKARYE